MSKSSGRPGLAWQLMRRNEPGKFSTVGLLVMFWTPLACAANKTCWQCTLAKALLLTNGLFPALGCWGEGGVYFRCGVNYFDAEGMQVASTSYRVRTEADLLPELIRIYKICLG